MKLIYLMWAIALLLPIGLKSVIPALLHEQNTLAASNSSFYTVQEIAGNHLTVHAPNGSTQSIQLAGLAPLPAHWQHEMTGVLSSLLQASGGQVSVTVITDTPRGQTSALVKLPNGMLVQTILLAEGLAKLDRQQLSNLPPDVQTSLQQIQASAQQQHKNVWGQS
jgi:endonuclease YncB( thermonuclease family)